MTVKIVIVSSSECATNAVRSPGRLEVLVIKLLGLKNFG